MQIEADDSVSLLKAYPCDRISAHSQEGTRGDTLYKSAELLLLLTACTL
jgi:hypothetical protein